MAFGPGWRKLGLLALLCASELTCGGASGGELTCWGATTNSYEYPETNPGYGPVLAAVLSDKVGCAMKIDKTIVCWGSWLGQQKSEGTVNVTELTGSTWFTGVITNGRIKVSGQEGQHAASQRATRELAPTGASPTGGAWRSLTIGRSHGCAVDVNTDNVTCWGYETNAARLVPEDLGPVASLHSGEVATCAVLFDQTLRCWGDSTRGGEVPSDLGQVHHIQGWNELACVVTVVGRRIRCWGQSFSGTFAHETVPTDLPPMEKVVSSSNSACGLSTNSELFCWGASTTTNANNMPTGRFGSFAIGRNNMCVIGGGATATTTTSTRTSATSTETTSTTATSVTITGTSTTTLSTLTKSSTTSESSTSSTTRSLSTSSSSTSSSSTTRSTSSSSTSRTSSTSSSSSSTSVSTTSSTGTSTSSSSTSSATSSTSTSSSRTSTSSSTSSSRSSTTSSSSSSSRTTSTSSSSTSSYSSSSSSSSTSFSSTSSSSSSTSSSRTSSSSSASTSTSTSATSTSSTSLSTSTSSSSTSSSPPLATQELTGLVDSARELLSGALASGEEDVVAGVYSWGSAAMTRPGLIAEARNRSRGGPVTLRPFGPQFAASDMEVRLPASLLAGPLARVLGELQMLAGLEVGGRGPSGEDAGLEVLGKTVLELRTEREALNISELQEPIEFSLLVDHGSNLGCAYWDEAAGLWSTRGVSVSRRSRPGGRLWCSSYHLSLFGAIVQGIVSTIACANFDLLNDEAFANLRRGDWASGPGANLCWALLALFALLYLAADVVDRKRLAACGWRTEFFLVQAAKEATPAPATEEEEGPPAVAGEVPTGGSRARPLLCGVCAACSSACAVMGESSALREALDDILSRWCQWFSQARSISESVLENMQAGELASCACREKMLVATATHFTALSASRMSRGPTGLSDGVVAFALHDESLRAFLMDEHSKRTSVRARARSGLQQPSQEAGDADWKMRRSQVEALQLLHAEVTDQVLQQSHKAAWASLSAVGTILWASNPMCDLFHFDIFINCKQRVLLFADGIMGTFALSCLFFEASGLVRGKPKVGVDCGGDDSDGHWGNAVGRFIVIATGSLLVANLPVTLLESLLTKGLKTVQGGPECLAWQKQLWSWALQEMLFWLLGAAYLAFCTFFVLLFLANVGPADSEDWFAAGGVALLEDLVVLPVAMALFVPLMARSFLVAHSWMTNQPPRHVFRQVCERLHNESNIMLPITQA